MNRFTRGINYLYAACFLSLLASMSIHFSTWQQVSMYAVGGMFVVDYLLYKRWQGWQWTRDKWAYLLLVVFYALPWIRNIFDPTPTTHFFYSQMETRAAFAIIGAMGLLGLHLPVSHRTVAYTMLCSSMMVIIVSVVLYLTDGSGLDYFDVLHKKMGSHMLLDLYMTMATLFGMLTLERSQKKWEKVLLGIICLVVAGRVLFSDGRSGMIIQAALLVAFAARTTWRYKRILTLPVAAICIIIGSMLVMQHDRMGRDHLVSANPRLALWNVAQDMIMERPIFGYGLSTTSVEYVRRATDDPEVQRTYLLSESEAIYVKNDPTSLSTISPHNMWLLLWMESGIAGPLCLMLILGAAIWSAPKRYHIYLVSYASLIAWQAMYDTFSTHFSPIFIALMLAIWLATSLKLRKRHTIDEGL